jgi:serine/threonine protein kinase
VTQHATQHPTPQQLADFALGRGGDEVVDAVAAHIETCETCCEALATVTDDAVVRLARTAMREYESLQSNSADTDSDSLSQTSSDLSGHGSPITDDDVFAALRVHPRYRVLERIGTGGMGDVYKAEHRLMGRTVALKTVRGEFTNSPTAVSRFRNEVRSAARLSHPNIVTAFDAEHAGSIHFLAMEFVDGESLDQVVARSGPLSIEHAIDVVQQVADGLQHAFGHGMVHRDIKPQNLMLDEAGRVRILDFGLARFVRDEFSEASSSGVSAGITAEHRTLGTPDYIAPEQVSDARTSDIRSDIYSIGCTLYFLLTGQPPFPNGSPMETMSAHLHLQPPSIATFRNDVPASVASIIEQMIAKSPDGRFQTPDELLAAIDRGAGFQPAGDRMPSCPTNASSSERLRPSRRVLLLVGVCGILASGAFALWPTSNGPEGQQASRTTGDVQPRVLFVLPNNLAFPDYLPVRDVLQQSGVQIETAAFERQVISNGLEDHPPFNVDHLLGDVDPTHFDAAIFVGGEMVDLTNEGGGYTDVKRIAGQVKQQQGVLAGICLGLTVLSDADQLRDHEVVYSSFIQHEFDLQRATSINKLVHTDGQLVTAEGPEAAREFGDAILKALGVP